MTPAGARSALCSAVLLVLLATGPSFAASFTVNDVADLVDALPGDGLCDAAPGTGLCTLRAAIQEANALPGADQITLPPGTYALTIPPSGNNDDGASGDLDVYGDLLLQGAGRGTTIVDGSGLDRVLHAYDTDGMLPFPTVTISGITVRNGALTVPTFDFGGGGILSLQANLALVDAVVSGNHDLTSGANGTAGGIASAGLLTLTRSVVSNNTALLVGGGLGILGGTATVQDTTIADNAAAAGGGLFTGCPFFCPTVTVDRSTISGNAATATTGPYFLDGGGGVANQGATLTLTNVTVSGNTSRLSGGGIWGAAAVRSSTIVGNVADSDANGTGDGGGVYSLGGSITLRNTILGANTDSGGQAPDCAGTMASQGYNLVQATAGCTLSGDATGNLVGISPTPFTPLQDNGGLTRTHGLLSGNPAVEAGNPALPGSGGTACPSSDQRETARPQGTRCDIGAYEAGLLGGVRNFVVNGTADAPDAQPGNDVCETGTGNGVCTLRAAVQEANAKTGSDTIFVPSGTYALTRAGANEDGAFTGDLDLNDSVTIVGGGAGATTIDAGGIDRVFDVKWGTTVQLNALRISGGSAGEGGGIRSQGNLTLSGCVVRDNQATGTWDGYYGLGAGIESDYGTLVVNDSVVRSNRMQGTYGYGTGIYATGSATITRSYVVGNYGPGAYAGGGIYAAAGLALVDSELRDNAAAYGGGAYVAYGTTTVSRTAVYDNLAYHGGGLYLYDAEPARIENSTLSANAAFGDGGGIVLLPAGAITTLANVTIVRNVADDDGNGTGDGGGLAGDGGAVLQNSIVAQNTDRGGQAPDCALTLTSNGYNLLGSLAGCPVTGTMTGNLVGIDPQLGSFQSVGGYSWAHPFAPTSPARNAGNPSLPGSGGAACAAVDQRSATRPQGTACDIGACEELVLCGNGVSDPGEQCDDGNTNDKDACTGACTTAVCGDSLVRTGVEECDDGATPGGDGCEPDCTLTASVVSAAVGAGQSVTTDTDGNGATPSNPVEATVTPPVAGSVIVTRNPSTAPSGAFSVLGGVTQISAPAGTPAAPLILVFSIDAGLIPAGQTSATIQVRKNGVLVPTCTGAAGVASPDPCVASRTTLGDGDVQVTVLTSTASAWEMGTLEALPSTTTTTTTPVTTTTTTLPPCVDGAPATKPKLTATKLAPPTGDDKLTIKGEAVIPLVPALDPPGRGVRLLLASVTGATLLDVTVPPGAYDPVTKTGWKANGKNTAWTFKAPGTATQGIQKVSVKRASTALGAIKFGIKGKNGSYAVAPADVPVRATLVLDVPAAAGGQCVELEFPVPPPGSPGCVLKDGTTLKCK